MRFHTNYSEFFGLIYDSVMVREYDLRKSGDVEDVASLLQRMADKLAEYEDECGDVEELDDDSDIGELEREVEALTSELLHKNDVINELHRQNQELQQRYDNCAHHNADLIEQVASLLRRHSR